MSNVICGRELRFGAMKVHHEGHEDHEERVESATSSLEVSKGASPLRVIHQFHFPLRAHGSSLLDSFVIFVSFVVFPMRTGTSSSAQPRHIDSGRVSNPEPGNRNSAT